MKKKEVEAKYHQITIMEAIEQIEKENAAKEKQNGGGVL